MTIINYYLIICHSIPSLTMPWKYELDCSMYLCSPRATVRMGAAAAARAAPATWSSPPSRTCRPPWRRPSRRACTGCRWGGGQHPFKRVIRAVVCEVMLLIAPSSHSSSLSNWSSQIYDCMLDKPLDSRSTSLPLSTNSSTLNDAWGLVYNQNIAESKNWVWCNQSSDCW